MRGCAGCPLGCEQELWLMVKALEMLWANWRSSKAFWERLWWANCELAASGGGEGNHDSF